MSVTDLVLIILVAAGAFYAGFLVGRFKALAERGGTSAGGPQPLPGPLDGPYSEASSTPSGAPSGRRGPSPPASAGDDDSWAPRTPPRRSTKPPPAAAGLMSKGTAEKPGSRQK